MLNDLKRKHGKLKVGLALLAIVVIVGIMLAIGTDIPVIND